MRSVDLWQVGRRGADSGTHKSLELGRLESQYLWVCKQGRRSLAEVAVWFMVVSEASLGVGESGLLVIEILLFKMAWFLL